MDLSTPPKLTYGLATGVRVTVELTTESATDLATIRETLQRESAYPSIPVSKSVAVRRALEVYAASLSRQVGKDTLKAETDRASSGTYIDKRPAGGSQQVI